MSNVGSDSKKTSRPTPSDEKASLARRWGLARNVYAATMVRAERWLGVRVFRVRVRPLVASTGMPALPSGLSIRQVSTDELRALVAEPALQLDGTFIDSAAASTAIMTGVFENDRLAAYAFATGHAVPAGDGMWVKCDYPYRYSFKSFTRPEYRGRRLSTFASLASDAMFMNLGYTHAISYTETHNFASIRTEASKGNVLIGIAGYVRFGSSRLSFRSPGCRRVGFAFYPSMPEERYLIPHHSTLR
jgi:hypothetical protein